MPWPVNENAEQMYALYNDGFTLSQVAKAYSMTRQSVYGLFKYRGWPLREKKQLPYVVFNGNKYTLRNNGYYGRTDAKRTLLHRDVWEFHNGAIPENCDIHHIDEDKLNNNIENLECLQKAEHTRRYSPHNNQYTKGRKRR